MQCGGFLDCSDKDGTGEKLNWNGLPVRTYLSRLQQMRRSHRCIYGKRCLLCSCLGWFHLVCFFFLDFCCLRVWHNSAVVCAFAVWMRVSCCAVPSCVLSAMKLSYTVCESRFDIGGPHMPASLVFLTFLVVRL